ncbi:DUF4032 domain-containing protein [Thermospira aquatica]|uniref:DUF4032 domain-containing protein n=1 Tax=Thermospira aquatica TaxID=2828656 RepID=A0AAX3BE85_9SPIR|nr:DUF4032 domain-containing protein [Thermospira aquatica]URA10662.1 hypothetical protein KDW03_02325 [Thermospira aquatica]
MSGIMVMRSKCFFDLERQVQDVIHEIEVYKWLESEKRGYDIGLSQATREWIAKHYDDWFKYNCQKYIRK